MKKKKFFAIVIIILVILIALTFYIIIQHNKDRYYFKDNSFSYSKDRGSPKYDLTLKEKNESYDTYAVNFESRNFLNYTTKIYGLLFIPNNARNIPGLVLLPGGAVKKENEAELASKIANLGYAVLTFDQRGIGETGGYYLNPEEDYKIFSQGKEPIQHLSVYDALKAYDVLRKIKNIDSNNIGIAGESMGGRYAIIAAAIDKRLKGAIIISSSGFHVKNENLPYTPYLLSIDPDSYIGKISPNHVFMLHSYNDSVIPIKEANFTFSLAKEPKKFYSVNNCAHGYCNSMYDELKQDLKAMFGK